MKSFQTGVDYLDAGEIVGIFPEATISRSFELKEFKTGAVRLAAAAGCAAHPAGARGGRSGCSPRTTRGLLPRQDDRADRRRTDERDRRRTPSPRPASCATG